MLQRYLLLLCSLSLAAFAQADASNSTEHIYPNAPYSFAHADLNNDGREDLVSICGSGIGNGNGQIGISLSTADGVYAPQVCYALPSGSVYNVVVGDFNGDGHLDLIALGGSNSFYEFLNNGDGTFHLQGTFKTALSQIYWMVAGDANHDGKIDLVFNDGITQNLYVYFGNGDGGFSVGPTSALPVQGELWIGDFDGDGNLDILTQFNTYGNTIQVAYGDGQGHFQVANSFGDNAVYQPYDVNGDGKMDLLGEPFDFSINGSTYYKDVRIMYGNANRTFTQADIPLKQCNGGALQPAAADVNGDGIIDLIVTEASDCNGSAPYSYNVMYGTGNGTYKPEQKVYSNTDYGTVSVLRVNQDTRPDFYFCGESSYGSGDTTGVFFTNPLAGNFPKCTPPNAGTGIHFCSPASGSDVTSPVTFSVGASNQALGRKVEVWIDGKKVGEQLTGWSHYSFLDAKYDVASGSHTVTVFSAGWDNLLESVSFPLTVK
jgi:hypothetical protein